ncbi:Hypothetical predicted protein [Lecanosticta acicola]|uniref:Stress response protein ish1 n=1 Tax=Lecanosticta acicola TaxID=111012 RepID=A0AAI9EBT7_9PEZI|nr:Hypothetical predicted protein [Lecanosticta acicola]
MKLSFASLAVVALATQSVAGDWLGRAAYNKWHETELERWLSDHDIPYPAAADRKDLENLVKSNWENNIAKPYNSWDTNQLQSYLSSKGKEVKKGTEKNKDSLIQQVQSYWHESADQANDAYSSVQSWVFNTWTESQLKAFLDYHGIPNPSPRTRDSLLSTARSNYQSIANKAGETASYPGNWLWSQWSDSELKAWLDERGVPVPQPSNRDSLIASIRRNAKVASDRAAAGMASATASAAHAQQSLTDQMIEKWGDSDIKEWLDKNGVKVPQGSKRNELVALARKHSAQLTGNSKSSASSAYGAATSSAGNWFAQQTNEAYGQFRQYYDLIANQFGVASAEAQKSLSSASSTASIEASKSSVAASKSAVSASSQAGKSASSAASSASSAYKKATDSAKKEL